LDRDPGIGLVYVKETAMAAPEMAFEITDPAGIAPPLQFKPDRQNGNGLLLVWHNFADGGEWAALSLVAGSDGNWTVYLKPMDVTGAPFHLDADHFPIVNPG
jgi:hypothetical protein